ncbi:MAG: hypothetical protein KAI47_24675 [Deltaproteobacteria bacterium]|nr:hypothetical protein [Deltaproteobacteria bacterium]
MSFDITFHPVAIADLERLVFDVWRVPERADKRAREVSEDPEKRRFILEAIYGPFDAWRSQAAGGALRFDKTLGFACAAIAGYRHGYFYGGASAISFATAAIPALALFTPLGACVPGARDLDLGDGLLTENYSASGLILPEAFDDLHQGLDLLDTQRHTIPALFSLFEAPARDALDSAIIYAEKRGLALMEVSDLIEPAEHRGSTDLDNLRVTKPQGVMTSDPEQLFPCHKEN